MSAIAQLKQRAARKALQQAGSERKAAKLLGVTRRTIHRWINLAA